MIRPGRERGSTPRWEDRVLRLVFCVSLTCSVRLAVSLFYLSAVRVSLRYLRIGGWITLEPCVYSYRTCYAYAFLLVSFLSYVLNDCVPRRRKTRQARQTDRHIAIKKGVQRREILK